VNRSPLGRLAALLFASLLFFPVATARAQDDSPLALGSPAPMRETLMMSVDGKERSIASVAGPKGTLVVFTCNTCPYAKAWEARIAAIGNAAIKRGLGVLAVNSNDPGRNAGDSYEEMVARAKKLGLKYPYVVDATSDLARAFGASATPEAFLFDAKGRLVYHGTVDDNMRDPSAVKEPWLREAVDAVVAGQTVATAETKAMGCSIKFRVKS
jgi:hypothetical protein